MPQNDVERLLELEDELDLVTGQGVTPYQDWLLRIVAPVNAVIAVAFVAAGIVALTLRVVTTGVMLVLFGMIIGALWFSVDATRRQQEEAARRIREEIDRLVEERTRADEGIEGGIEPQEEG